MNLLRALLGYTLALFWVFLPVAVISCTFLGLEPKSAWLALGISFAIVSLALAMGADWLVRLHRGGRTPDGVQVSLRRALLAHGHASASLPVVRVFADPAPNALVLRSLLGSGTILLSQGLLDRLGEEELRTVLAQALHRLSDPHLPLQTLTAALAAFTLRRASGSWMDALVTSRSKQTPRWSVLSVGAFVVFAFLVGYARLWIRAVPAPQAGSTVPGFEDLQRRLGQTNQTWGLRWIPGAARLYLFPPQTAPTADLMSLSFA